MELYAKDISPHLKKGKKTLLNKADRLFKAYIRERDAKLPCISCGRYGGDMHAGHFYSAGHYPFLRFDPYNVNKQCLRCNRYLHGNLIEYRRGLIERIGLEQVEEMDAKVDFYKRKENFYKLDKMALIHVILMYGGKPSKAKGKGKVLQKIQLS